jgi:dihydrofolate reductase
MKASVFIATSLDGFIARTDGDINWLDDGQQKGGGESGEADENIVDHGYHDFIETVDFLVMGRNSYEKVLSFGVAWPYKKPVVVLTQRPLDIPDELATCVEAMSGSPAEIIARLGKRGAQHLYIDGGKTIQTFLNAGLIQRLVITCIPILLGDGIPLFGPLSNDVRLRHVATRTFEGGLVQSEYEVA